MSANFVNIDRDTPMLFPPDLREWIPEDSIVHFIIDAVEELDLSEFSVNERGTGNAQYPPSMMFALLIYNYATGRFSSRKIEEATYTDVAVRYICGGDSHPDHDTICAFRNKNRDAFKKAFTDVLLMAQELGHLKKIGGISVDGTKIKANASKHSAVSYKRAQAMIKKIEDEIEQLAKKAEEADSTPLKEGLEIPEEIKRREKRKQALKEAKKAIEEQYSHIRNQKQKEYEEKKERRDDQRKNGNPPRGREPVEPPKNPKDNAQHNFTDPESRIMKAGNGKHYEQAYNAQAAVDTEGSMLILGNYVTNNPNDKKELNEILGHVDSLIREPEYVLADTGYFSEDAITQAEDKGTKVYCAVEKQHHHKTVEDIEKQIEPEAPPENATEKEKMRFRLKTKEGSEKYKKRKETVEPVFGIIKSVLGFRQFLQRGLEKVNAEWDLVTTAYNLKRLYTLSHQK